MRPVSIFIAEDNPADVELICEALRQDEMPFTLLVADNGELAAKLVASLGDEVPLPDLAIIDWNMPKVEGEALLQVIRANPRCANLPVLVMTSSQYPMVLQAIERYGAVYFCKPNDLNSFLKVADVVRSLRDVAYEKI